MTDPTHRPSVADLAVSLGTVVNHAYQSGMDEEACRYMAEGFRLYLPERERAMFTEAVEMCGLWLTA